MLVVGVLQVLRSRDRSANSLAVLLAASLFLGGCDGRTAGMSADNPFNTELNEPVAFGRVTANHVTEYARSIEASTVAAAAQIRGITAPTFDGVVRPFDQVSSELLKAASTSFMLFWVSPDSATRAAGLAAYQRLDSINNSLYADRGIFNQIVSVSQADSLTGVRKELVAELIRRMRHAGAELEPDVLARVTALKAEINDLSTQFSTNMNTDIPMLELDSAGVRGLPENFKATYATGELMYRIPVIPATAAPVQGNAEEEETRKRYYLAANTRAAEKNLPILDQLVAKRHELARLMGHASFADYALGVNMAQTPDRVWSFLNDVTERTRSKATADLAQLEKVRRSKPGLRDQPLRPWDAPYLQNALLKSEFNVDAEQIREYLPLNEALRGMMDLYQELLGFEFRRIESASVWHEEVEAYGVYENGALVGRFYLDLFPRPNKESWFYGVGLVPGRRTPNGYEIPVSMLLGNFTRATETLPSLVSHAELRTLFHEFGHIMNAVSYQGEFALQSDSKPDFGEAMSQIFENWIWDYDVLKTFAKHYKTGEVLPRKTFDNMLAARNVGSGLGAQNGLRRSVYDMMLYNRYDPEHPVNTDQLWTTIAGQFVYAPFVEGTHPQASWIHINTHPVYMYGYTWSAVYAADMFTQFETNGLRDRETGLRYRKLILANGTQRPIDEAVEEFLGRPMNSEAYVRSLGLSRK